MKRPTCLFVALAVAIAMLALPTSLRAEEDEITWDAPERVPVAIFKNIFGGSQVKKYPALLGIFNVFRDVNEDHELARMTFVQTKLRGRLALIPIESSNILRLTKRLAVVAFPIYLCAVCKGDEVPRSLYADMTVPSANRPQNKGEFGTKLFQVGFVDTADDKFLAKPEGYPLESSHWDTTRSADWAIDLNLEVRPVDGCRTCVQLRFTANSEPNQKTKYLQLFALTPSGAHTSARYDLGTRPSQDAKAVSVYYDDIQRIGNDIVARKGKTVGDQETSEQATLLKLPNDATREAGWAYQGE